MSETFDFIIVGAGSAGCVLARRLSRDPDCRVLLLEAGPRDWNPFIHMPAAIAKLIRFRSINWAYETEPEPELNNRRLYWPRGRVLGGSSSINAMCYTRGHRADYDGWEALGNPGWGWRQVMEYFRKAEDQSRGESELHGSGGPLSVEDLRHVNPLSRVFLEAAVQAGYPANPDFNGPRQRGFGFYQVTQRDGARCSTATAYLDPARQRRNLDIRTGAFTQRIEFDGRRARRVCYRSGGRVHRVVAEREIILSAGSINSPQLLMLSGIGPAGHLRSLDIDVIADLPGVGGNLQDHLDICTLVGSREPVTYDQVNEVMVGMRYWIRREGIGTSNIAEAGGFVVSERARQDRPDIQMHFVPAFLDDHGRNRIPGHGYTLHAAPLQPLSRGKIRLQSDNPKKPPAIHANYLSAPEDLDMMLECVKASRRILSQPAFAPYRAGELYPGGSKKTDEELIAFIRARAETIYHPVGTCAMGTGSDAVVDAELRVRGVEGLRVADASVMPVLVSGNTNAPVIMIAEKAADLILGRASIRPQATRKESAAA